METRSPEWKAIVGTLAFIAVCAAIALGAWLSFGGSVPLQAAGYRVTVDLPQANSLLPNSDVRIAGVNVGKVRSVSRSAGGRARVVLELDAEFAPLRRDARVLLRTKTLMGEGYVEIAPGDRAAAVVPDGGRLEERPGQPRQQRLDEVLETFGARSRRDLRAMLSGFERAFRGRPAAANEALGQVEGTVVGLRRVAEKLDAQRAPMQQLVAASSDVFGAVGRHRDAILGIVRDGRTAAATVAAQQEGLRRTIAALPPFLRDLRGATTQLGDASGDLGSASVALRRTVPLLRPALASLSTNAPAYERVFDAFTPTLKSTARTLPELQRIVESADPAMEPLHLAMRQLIPLMKMFAATSETTVASLANQGAVFNGQAVNETGATQGYVSAWLTAWNEIVGGWVKKLPSHRSNPYPAPKATSDIANGGIASFDCRNTGNPPILPPFGTGTPPCKLQGPWTFDGKTAYYPRLELAKP